MKLILLSIVEVERFLKNTLKQDKNSMNTAEEFERLAKEWAKYCDSIWFSSNTLDYLNHSAYRKLVKLGPPAIPYIMEEYQKEDNHLDWEFVLYDITGMNLFGNSIRYNPSEVKERWLEWWELQAKEPQAQERWATVCPRKEPNLFWLEWWEQDSKKERPNLDKEGKVILSSSSLPHQKLNMNEWPHDKLIRYLAAEDDKCEKATQYLFEQGVKSFDFLLAQEGNKNPFFCDCLLGTRSSWRKMTPPVLVKIRRMNRQSLTESEKEFLTTIEVASLYLISAIYYERIDFVWSGGLIDSNLLPGAGLAIGYKQDYLTRGFQAVREWVSKCKRLDIETLRKQGEDPLKSGNLAWW
ncbi:MAG: hypothetical protein DRR16_26040 [Candidatus Parabeggiatoa sp. nov. 3]|nr:MAG: hypothetical protein DRR00_14830 [Gammaproteobacteria bacterium]RKZ60040.1 MAG: hypothetical protein DRQ99_22760 [Gammaproteobacteria bacterium]RKZ79259.1 MAG: hypothetical protein DRR16_26040 [Gammaproteobacteria bacterium]